MRTLVAFVVLISILQSAHAGPFGVFRRGGGPVSNTANAVGNVARGGFASAQAAAEHMARIGRIGHFGGNPGYEGVGAGSTPQAAEMNCCYRGRMTPREVGIAQGANGMYYACCRY
jgi:hypothetical protein